MICNCDADIETHDDDPVGVFCVECGEMISDYEVTKRWNKHRAEIERLQHSNCGLRALIESHEAVRADLKTETERLEQSWTESTSGTVTR